MFALWRLGIATSLLLGIVPALGSMPPARTTDFDGKVVPLATVLKKLGARLDEDAGSLALAFVTSDDKVYPLVKDDGSRMFFKDERLLNRRMRLTGRVLPEVGMFQVVDVHSYLNGQLHEVYYWCDICSIRRSQKGICDCCNGPLQLREEPVKK
jgi:hypothetical protein